ncbi:MAG TPA: L-threonylcarbamoyladenylate synthase [Anaerolineales bacterium]|nr:L-threonylcarbamoyladenylate synthase [Anaerolineales bacterium]
MKTRVVSAADPHATTYALDVLHHQGLVAFPTDTVYGLAAAVFDPAGLDRLFAVKGRNQTKAIAVLLAELTQLDRVARDLPDRAKKLAAAFWPGPLTLVVPRAPGVPEVISVDGTIGVRIPDHDLARKLIGLTGPLAVTSANLSGAENTRTAEEVLAQLDGRIDLLLDGGRTPGGLPSTVVDCRSGELKILREGPVSRDQIRAAA